MKKIVAICTLLPAIAAVTALTKPKQLHPIKDPSQVPAELKLTEAPPKTFTLAVIPDTQLYYGTGAAKDTNSVPRNPAFLSRVSWIADNIASQRIVFVSHMGDIVDRNNHHQWKVAKQYISRFNDLIPYGLTVGNHDLRGATGDSSLFQQYFGAENFTGKPWYGGYYQGRQVDGVNVSGNNANSFQFFSAEGINFIILHLECNAPDDVLAWADDVLRRHPRHLAIISTHMYLGIEVKKPRRELKREQIGKRMLWKKVHGARGNTPQQLWEKCFSQHPQILMILAGDQSGVIAARQQDIGRHGNLVYEIMQDYPRRSDYDDWLRLFRFDPQAGELKVITYSPIQQSLCGGIGYLPEIEHHQFTLDISAALQRYRQAQ